MPIWGWVCIGLFVAAVLGVAVLAWLGAKQATRFREFGKTVVARIILANPSLYEKKSQGFEFAFLLFTRDNDPSEEHLAFLAEVATNLRGFAPDETSPEEKKLAWSLETQRTTGAVVRVPDRVTGGREVYFATTSVLRRMLPGGMLTREYLCLRVILDGDSREVTMTEYPDAPTGKG
jgi:hypothetical protein